MQNPFILKYLFEAEFTDGTVVKQTPLDTSKIDPKRSEYYDILNSGKTIKRFSLVGNKNKVTVDLTTGLFEVNGLSVLLESDKLPILPDKFTLIFYRQHTHNQNITYNKSDLKELKRGAVEHFCEYFIGWQCVIKGKNYQQKIAII